MIQIYLNYFTTKYINPSYSRFPFEESGHFQQRSGLRTPRLREAARSSVYKYNIV